MSTSTSFSILKDTTREQKLIFLSLSIGYITLFCPTTLTPPFFPPEGARHGISSSLIGMIFSVSSLMSVLISPFAGLLITSIGPKMVIISGILVNGVFAILFGLMENVESMEWFVAGCFICMGFMALGVATVYTATLTYISKLFPGNMSLVVGITEMYIAVAEILALLTGGFLHDLGGYKLPFILIGSLHLLVIPLDLFLLPTDQKTLHPYSQADATPLTTVAVYSNDPDTGQKIDGVEIQKDRNVNSLPQDFFSLDEADEDEDSVFVSVDAKSSSISKLPPLVKSIKYSIVSDNVHVDGDKSKLKSNGVLTNAEINLSTVTLKNAKALPDKLRLWHLVMIPRTVLMAVVILVTGISWSFLKSTLEPHLSPLNLSKTGTNLVFLLMSVMYGITSPFWGWFSERVEKTWLLMSGGLILAGITFCFIGPVPFLGLKNSLWLNAVSLIIISTSLTAAGVPAAESTLLYALEAGYKDNIDTYAIVSSLIATMYCSGAAIGAISGGFLLEAVGYEISAGICGSIGLLWGICVLTYFILFHNKATPHSHNSCLEQTVEEDKEGIEGKVKEVENNDNITTRDLPRRESTSKPIVRTRKRTISAGSFRVSNSFISSSYVPVSSASPNLDDPEDFDYDFTDSRLSMS